jgi:protein-tyrosine phosphatase
MLRHLPAAIQFIREGIKSGGVLVHCFAGVSRSATCVIAFLMQEKKLQFDQAFTFVSKKRPVVFPNMGFQQQLLEFQKLLNIKNSATVGKQL